MNVMKNDLVFTPDGVADRAALRRVSSRKLGELLISGNLITREDLDQALEIQGKEGGRLGEILVKQGKVQPENILSVISVQSNVPMVDLKDQKIDPSVISLLTEEIARKSTILPIELKEDVLVMAMAYPDDVRTIRDIATRTGKSVQIVLALPADILNAIDLYYRAGKEIENSVGQMAGTAAAKEETIAEVTDQTPVAQTLELILKQAVKDRASDIHVEPQKGHLRIRFRIDGILNDMYTLPISVHAPLVSRIKILSQMNIAEQRRSQDGQMSTKVRNKDIDIRVASMLTSHGERVALRILDKTLSPLSLEEVGFLPEQLGKYRNVLRSPFGTVLVGGPTGSGKTTTLYASLNTFDRKALNIITIEDPVEYEFKDINQTQINPKAGITFASGLRTILRHDPDVVLVGEIRDRDTAEIATQASLTGRLVLATIHANDAISILFRLIDLGIEPFLIAPTLVGAMAQRMVRRICPYCKTNIKPSAEEEIAFIKEFKESPRTVSVGKGCNMCANTGYRGRVALTELLVMTENLRRMVLSGASADEIKNASLKEGMLTMQRDGILKVKMGITTFSEVLRTTFSIY
ncbi:MAG: type secretory pathway, ATPase PulE/Tfp pilus assembly pathway, ATPase PilB [Chloroflexi bacterium]|nr:type secretory pathway, ATPase PulE/Tfp pilus assembly pathway, ATPase PilB [Chloroflexota bacterium]